MSPIPFDPIDDIRNSGAIHDHDVLRLRKMVYGKPGIAVDDIDALFGINDTATHQDASWAPFFIEVVTDYVVSELPPQGYVTAENADWLLKRICHDGRVDSATELELLVNVLDKARWVPESLARFALDQVEHAVVHATGPLRSGRQLQAGQITLDEVALVRRILYAFGGDGNVAITRTEAEALFNIEDATSTGLQVPEWQELFVKAIASVIMAASGYKVPLREEALRQEKWLASRGDLSIGNILGNMLQTYDPQTPEERALARLERQRIEIITNAEVTETEAGWLAERIGRDGRITHSEQMLLAFLKRESPKLHPSLQTLVDRAA